MLDDGNSTRLADAAEIAEALGLRNCGDPDCVKEKEFLRQEAAEHHERMQYFTEHEEEVRSMVIAGVDLPISTEKPEMMVTVSAAGPTQTDSLPAGRTGHFFPTPISTHSTLQTMV